MIGPELELVDVSAWFGVEPVLQRVSARLPAGQITALLGSAGSGKTTLARLFNRLNELEPDFRSQGQVRIGGTDLRERSPEQLRRDVGMIFERPTAFPGSIRDNVSFGLRLLGLHDAERDERVEEALRRADLWDDLADRLDHRAATLGPGPRQLLCIARALALRPSVLVLDEPNARLHPADGARIERVVRALSPELTVLFVTPDISLAGRVAEHVALLDGGRLIESGEVEELFTNPRRPETQAYLSRRFS